MGREVDMVIVWPLGGSMCVVCVREGLVGRCGLRGIAFKPRWSVGPQPASPRSVSVVRNNMMQDMMQFATVYMRVGRREANEINKVVNPKDFTKAQNAIMVTCNAVKVQITGSV